MRPVQQKFELHVLNQSQVDQDGEWDGEMITIYKKEVSTTSQGKQNALAYAKKLFGQQFLVITYSKYTPYGQWEEDEYFSACAVNGDEYLDQWERIVT